VLGPTLLATALTTFARSGGAPPEEALACANETIRLTEEGAGDSSYASALQTAAVARLSLGDRPGAARDALKAVATDAKNGNRAYVANDIFVASEVLAAQPDGVQASAILSAALAGREFASMPLFFEETYGSARSNQLASEADGGLPTEAVDDARRRGSLMAYEHIIAFALNELKRVAETPDGWRRAHAMDEAIPHRADRPDLVPGNPGRSGHCCSDVDGVQLPLVGNALECMGPSVVELDPRTDDQVLDGARTNDLTGFGCGHDARGQVHRDTTDVTVAKLDLTSVKARVDL
jgi:hypothetical protein